MSFWDVLVAFLPFSALYKHDAGSARALLEFLFPGKFLRQFLRSVFFSISEQCAWVCYAHSISAAQHPAQGGFYGLQCSDVASEHFDTHVLQSPYRESQDSLST